MKFALLVALPLVALSSHSVPASAAVRCADADLSNLAKQIYVSPQGNDAAGCGQSTASPCKTIQQGITNCTGTGCGVLVRYGVYNITNPLRPVAGVNLYGSCIFDETAYAYRSTVIGNPAIWAVDINTATLIQGFVILGSAAVHTSEASVALMVSNSSGLRLSRDVIASGRGGMGENGSVPSVTGGQSGLYAPNDTTGGAGGRACNLNPPSGSTGKGGKGADRQQLHTSWGIAARATCTNNNYPASLGETGQASGSVSGGSGGVRGSAGCACSGAPGDNPGSGGEGASGRMGASGTQGGSPNPDTKGSFAGTIWRPNVSGNGNAGQVGSGGGGGGSGGFGANRSHDYSGFPGGGGGGGGCGGPGGTGARQGGASVPLVLFASSVAGLADSNVLIPGPGGQGGRGGGGARGGAGGSGASGYLGQLWNIEQGFKGAVCKGTVPGRGGKGGSGGQGGAGSGGAGGNGGPSFAIALVNATPLSSNGLTIYPGQAGPPGGAGAGGQNDPQNKGADGTAGMPGFSNTAQPILSFTSATQLIGGHL